MFAFAVFFACEPEELPVENSMETTEHPFEKYGDSGNEEDVIDDEKD